MTRSQTFQKNCQKGFWKPAQSFVLIEAFRPHTSLHFFFWWWWWSWWWLWRWSPHQFLAASLPPPHLSWASHLSMHYIINHTIPIYHGIVCHTTPNQPSHTIPSNTHLSVHYVIKPTPPHLWGHLIHSVNPPTTISFDKVHHHNHHDHDHCNHQHHRHDGGRIFEMRIRLELISGGRARQAVATRLCALHILNCIHTALHIIHIIINTIISSSSLQKPTTCHWISLMIHSALHAYHQAQWILLMVHYKRLQADAVSTVYRPRRPKWPLT